IIVDKSTAIKKFIADITAIKPDAISELSYKELRVCLQTGITAVYKRTLSLVQFSAAEIATLKQFSDIDVVKSQILGGLFQKSEAFSGIEAALNNVKENLALLTKGPLLEPIKPGSESSTELCESKAESPQHI